MHQLHYHIKQLEVVKVELNLPILYSLGRWPLFNMNLLWCCI